MNDTNYIFRKFYYVTIMLKKSKNDEIINNCLNIDCSLFEINRFKFNKHFVVNFTIKQLLLLLSIRDIDNTIHHISEYTVVSLYVDDYIVDQIDEKRFAIVKIQIEFHIVDDLRINILIENDVFRAQRITLNLKKQTIILINCRNFIIFINVTTKKLIKSASFESKLISKYRSTLSLKCLLFIITVCRKIEIIFSSHNVFSN